MPDTRHANKNWMITDDRETRIVNSWDQVQCALLMDLRDELQKLNRLLACPNFTGIPRTLKAIERQTKKRKRITRKLK